MLRCTKEEIIFLRILNSTHNSQNSKRLFFCLRIGFCVFNSSRKGQSLRVSSRGKLLKEQPPLDTMLYLDSKIVSQVSTSVYFISKETD